MIDIIAGAKGRGKTKILLQRVNEDIKTTHGTIVYLDKNNKHMYELNNQIRLIVVPEFDIIDSDMFIGFIAGILSQDHDLDKIFLDSFLTIAEIKDDDTECIKCIRNLERLSNKFDVDFIISVSKAKEDLPEEIQQMVSVAL